MRRIVNTRLEGVLTGFLWGGFHGELAAGLNISRDAGRPLGGFKDVIGGFCKLAGDFVDAKLTPDSFITITVIVMRNDRVLRRERSIDVTRFPSIAEYVAKIN